jgi:hypothetical protein
VESRRQTPSSTAEVVTAQHQTTRKICCARSLLGSVFVQTSRRREHGQVWSHLLLALPAEWFINDSHRTSTLEHGCLAVSTALAALKIKGACRGE